MAWRWTILLGALLALPAFAGVLEIETFWVPEGENQFTFLVGNHVVCRFSGRAPKDVNSIPGTCRLDLPADATTLTVRGRYTLDTWDSRTDKYLPRTAAGERTFRLRDAGAITRPLRDASLPIAERWRRTRESERVLAAAYGGATLIETAKPLPPLALVQAEKRLGFALPSGYRDLVSAVGPVAFGDHSVPGPEQLETADKTILQRWSYGESGNPEWLSPAARERLEHSVILFFEVGDGMGAQLFLAPPNTACGDRFATIFFRESSLPRAMRELAADHLGCQPFEAALLDQATRLVLLEHENGLREKTGELLIDSSASTAKLHLNYSIGPSAEFQVDLGRE